MTKTIRESICELISRNELSEKLPTEIAALLSSDGKTFIEEECAYWDYKEEFPFSSTDDFFAGIVRLICAFHNTYGGLIIFGVNDIERVPGRNKVAIKVEKLNTRLRELCSEGIETVARSYDLVHGQVDILLVPKRNHQRPPVYLTTGIGKYEQGNVFIRKSHEVLLAQSQDLPFLYSEREDFDIAGAIGKTEPIKVLPPSPATINQFVGRFDVLRQLWNWYSSSDEPRTFLYGKGGSGKSTIAYEFARLVADSPTLRINGSAPADIIIYLSAKKRKLNTERANILPDTNTDFTNSGELGLRILEYADWFPDSESSVRELEQVKTELGRLLDEFPCLFVIDDIDTLTTEGTDPGMDWLYKLLIRAQKNSKVLYTLRNAPSQSILNSIEVPGLNLDAEYREFVEECVKQFSSDQHCFTVPSDGFMFGELATISERRPLVIETIIALRRTCDSYSRAIQLFRDRVGDDTRDYLFRREWMKLSRESRSRELLAALSLIGRPATFDDLESVLSIEPTLIRDAIAESQEMFIKTGSDSSTGSTTYELGSITSAFVAKERETLDRASTLRERVKARKRNIHPTDQKIENIRRRLGRYYRDENPSQALDVLLQENEPKITENPPFKALLGIALAKQIPPRIESAREAFDYALRMGYVDAEYLRAWFYMERTSGHGLENAIRLCDNILQIQRLEERLVCEFRSKKAFACLIKGRNEINSDPEIGEGLLAEAVILSLQACDGFSIFPEIDLSESIDRCVSAFSTYNQVTLRSLGADGAFAGLDLIDRIAKEFSSIPIDPISDELSSLIRRQKYQVRSEKQAGAQIGKLSRLRSKLLAKSGARLELLQEQKRKELLSEIEEVSADLELSAKTLSSP